MAVTVNPKRQRVWLIVVAVVMINLICWFVGGFCLGGDALSGYADDGSLFVGSHGTYLEVSHAAWIYSKIRKVLTFFINIPIAAAFGFWAMRCATTHAP
jgi:hypothetical protein